MRFCNFTESPYKRATRLGMKAQRMIDGRWKLGDSKDFSTPLVYNSKAELEAAMSEIAAAKSIDLDASFAFPWRGETSSPINPNFGEPLDVGAFGMFHAAMQTSFLKVITPMKAYAQSLEKVGLGRSFSKVFEPTQAAMNKVHQELGYVKRAVFGDKTYAEAFTGLRGKVAGLTNDERELMMFYSEALSRDELIRPGMLFKDGMTAGEVQLAKELVGHGLADDIPRLLALSKTVKNMSKRREKFLTQDYPQLMLRVQEKELPEEFGLYLQKLRDMAGQERSIDELVVGLKLNEAEQTFILQALQADDSIRWAGIYRYATSFDLKKGFKTGREQFASERGVGAKILDATLERDKILQEAFRGSGRNEQQLVFGQMPVFREFIKHGLPPSKEFKGYLSSMEEGTDLFSKRVLGGTLSPYNLDPLTSTYKHVRNILMKDNYDPILKDVMDEVRSISSIDAQSGETLKRYLLELEGFPNEGYDKLNGIIKTMGRALGVGIDDNLANRVVNLLTNLSYKASIPFRPALVLRNYSTTAFFTTPVIGPKHWINGMKAASGIVDGKFSKVAYREMFDDAVKAGAIDPNVLPLHGASEIFGTFESGLSRRFGPTLAKANDDLEKAFDWAFEMYRSADDWGRAVAYHGAKGRVKEYEKLYRAGELTLEQFKAKAKVKTFDITVEDAFTKMIQNDQFDEAASYIGKQLADKTHFLYGNANHPIGWGGPFGRLFGQFGTFPVQYLDFLTQGLSRGTGADIAQFAAIHGGLNVGVGLAGAHVMGGIDLWNWATVPSLTYSGGPYLDLATTLFQMQSGSEAEKAMARRNLMFMIPTFEHPSSIFLPGSYFLADMADAAGDFMDEDYLGAFVNASGLRKLRPNERNPVEKGFEFMRDDLF